MLITRRVISYGAICLAIFVVLTAVIVKPLGVSNSRAMVAAPAALDGMVTISTSPDKKLTFITCAPYHPSLLQRILHSTISCAFIVQHFAPTRNVIAHAGRAHVEFLGDLLSVAFADKSRSVFTTAPKGAYREEGEVDYSDGIATYSVAGFGTHTAFVASHNRTQSRGSCGL